MIMLVKYTYIDKIGSACAKQSDLRHETLPRTKKCNDFFMDLLCEFVYVCVVGIVCGLFYAYMTSASLCIHG